MPGLLPEGQRSKDRAATPIPDPMLALASTQLRQQLTAARVKLEELLTAVTVRTSIVTCLEGPAFLDRRVDLVSQVVAYYVVRGRGESFARVPWSSPDHVASILTRSWRIASDVSDWGSRPPSLCGRSSCWIS